MVSLADQADDTATTPRRRPRRRGVRKLSGRDVVVACLMLSVPILIDLIFIWFPAVASVALSFTNWNGIGGLSTAHGVGADNYHQMVSIYPPFWPAVRHNVIWLLVFLVIATPLGILFAVIIDRGIRGSRMYQSILFLPVMLSLALVGIIWQFMYSTDNGLINTVLGRTQSGNAIDWLGNSHLNLWAVLVEASWRQAGYVMVLYLAGLKAVDPSLKEAALIDGATDWQAFRRVIFPVMRPINIVVLVITVIESLRAFDLVYITNRGVNGLELLSVLVTQNILGEETRIGFGSALGVVLLVISLVPITIFLYSSFKSEDRP
jgi:multiple sugar transport system permease protein